MSQPTYDVRIQGPRGVIQKQNVRRSTAHKFIQENTDVRNISDLLFRADDETIINVTVGRYDIGIESY